MTCPLRWPFSRRWGGLHGETMAGMAAVGELSLSGGVMGVRGALSMAIAAKEKRTARDHAARVQRGGGRLHRGAGRPAGRAPERGDRPPAAAGGRSSRCAPGPMPSCWANGRSVCDFADVRGQKGAKRALEIAAAGGHNVLMIGPPGSGKTMMARCLPGILPDMTLEEALEVTRIHSAAGTLAAGRGADGRAAVPRAASHGQRGGAGRRRHEGAPRRNQPGAQRRAVPGRTAGVRPRRAGSAAPAAGGRLCQRRPRQRAGEIPRAGDARRGDEPVPLRQLRQHDAALPLHRRRKSRAIWGASPARCWTESTCSWRSRLSPCARSPRARRKSRPRRIHARVQAARRRQQARYAGEGVSSNAELSARQLEQFCPLDDACRELIGKSLRQIQPLHARGQPGAQGRADNRRPRGGGGTSARRICWKRCGIAIWKEITGNKGKTKCLNPKRWRFWSVRA